MSNNQILENSLAELRQAEPPAVLDERIKSSVKKLLALENYYNADTLLRSEHAAKLDAPTISNLHTAMSGIKEQFGNNFEVAYSDFVAQKNAAQSNEQQR